MPDKITDAELSAIKLAPELIDLVEGGDDPLLSHRDFRQLLLHQLDALGYARSDSTAVVIDAIAQAVPKEYKTERVAAMMDLRPYLSAIANSADFEHTNTWGHGSGGETADPIRDAADLLQVLQSSAEAVGQGMPGSDAASVAAIQSFDAAEAGVAPEARLAYADLVKTRAADTATAATPEAQAVSDYVVSGDADSFAADFAKITQGQKPNTSPAFSVEALRRTARSFGYGIQDIQQSVTASQQAALNAGLSADSVEFPVQMSGRAYGAMAGEAGRQGSGAEFLTAGEAINSIYAMTETEITQLSENLRDAGYFDRQGKAPDGTRGVADPALFSAWLELLGDAARASKPVDAVLRDEALNFKRRNEERVAPLDPKAKFDQLGRPLVDAEGNRLEYGPDGIPTVVAADKPQVLSLTDPNSIRWDADGRAAQLLDRYLTPNELDYVVELVHTAERSWDDEQRRVSAEGGEIVDLDQGALVDSLIKAMRPLDGSDHPITPDEFRMKYFRPAGDTLTTAAAPAGPGANEIAATLATRRETAYVSRRGTPNEMVR